MLAGEGVVEAILQHAVEHRHITHARAPAALRQEVGREVHVLHAAGHGAMGKPRPDLLCGAGNALRTRAADAIDGHCRHTHRQAPFNHRLTGRIHLAAGLNDLAHDDCFDLLRRQPGAPEHFTDHCSAQRGCRNVL